MKKLLNFYAFEVRLEDGRIARYGIYSKLLIGDVSKFFLHYFLEDILDFMYDWLTWNA